MCETNDFPGCRVLNRICHFNRSGTTPSKLDIVFYRLTPNAFSFHRGTPQFFEVLRRTDIHVIQEFLVGNIDNSGARIQNYKSFGAGRTKRIIYLANSKTSTVFALINSAQIRGPVRKRGSKQKTLSGGMPVPHHFKKRLSRSLSICRRFFKRSYGFLTRFPHRTNVDHFLNVCLAFTVDRSEQERAGNKSTDCKTSKGPTGAERSAAIQ